MHHLYGEAVQSAFVARDRRRGEGCQCPGKVQAGGHPVPFLPPAH